MDSAQVKTQSQSIARSSSCSWAYTSGEACLVDIEVQEYLSTQKLVHTDCSSQSSTRIVAHIAIMDILWTNTEANFLTNITPSELIPYHSHLEE